MTDCLILFAIVLGVNLMPAFGPPTWSIIVLYGLNTQLPVPLIVLTGAMAAAIGRFLLALAFSYFGGCLSDKSRQNLAAAHAALTRSKRSTVMALGLFALSPVPSAQLFEAAGLAQVRLAGFTAAFFAGRAVSYSIYAFTARSISDSSIGDILRSGLANPLGIALQLVMIGLLVALTKVDWAKRLR